MKLVTSLIIVTFLTGMFSCSNDCNSLRNNEIVACRGDNLFPDSSVIANQILGKWEWIKHTGGYGRNTALCADKKVEVTFDSNGSFEEVENGVSISQGNWTIIKRIEVGWLVEYSTDVHYLSDWIWFCQDYVMFEPSYVLDTGYHIFKKTD